MAFGVSRFFYNNFITAASMITADSQASGSVSGAEKTQGTSGTAIMVSTGDFTGATDLRYTVQIDGLGTGEVGSSTYRWKNSDTAAGSWEATGVTTSATPVTLNNGVDIFFTGGDGADFELSDTWVFETEATYSTGNLIDLDRNKIFRSGNTFDIEFNLGSAQNIKALILYDHNLTAATSTITYQMNTSSSWGAPPYSQALTITNPLILYLDETYQYQRLAITDGTIQYVEMSQIYQGDYLELTHNARWGTPRTHGYFLSGNDNDVGLNRRKVYTKQARIPLEYPVTLYANIDNLITMQEALVHEETTGIVDRLFLHLFSDNLSDGVWLVDWTNIEAVTEVYEYLTHGSITCEFAEQVKTRV